MGATPAVIMKVVYAVVIIEIVCRARIVIVPSAYLWTQYAEDHESAGVHGSD